MSELNFSYNEFAEKVENLLSENNRLQQLIQQKDLEIETLKTIAKEIGLHKSRLENKQLEIEVLKQSVKEYKHKAEAAIQNQANLVKELQHAVTIHHQLENAKSHSTHLQAQLDNLNERIKELTKDSQIESKYINRICELEDLLAEAEKEIEAIKNETA